MVARVGAVCEAALVEGTRLEAFDRLLDALVQPFRVHAGHLAGLQRLKSPARIRKVVARRGLVHLVVPAARGGLAVDYALKRLHRGGLRVGVLRHAVRLAESVGRDEERILVAIGSFETYGSRIVDILRIDKVLHGLLDRFAEVL